MKNKSLILYLVIPCYNEEEVLPLTKKELDKKMNSLIKSKKISKDSKVVFVNDGSKDNTWNIISKIHKENKMYVGINLSRNKGHQNALLAGLMYAKEYCDITISMDADLQDDINVIDDMILKYKNGNEIVYGVRSSRKKDKILKKITAEGFYKFMNLMGVEVVFNHADCRLMSKKTLEVLSEYKEVNLFLRGIIPQVGFKTSISYYDRNERVAGKSKYPLKKMLSFALDGITSFSIKPLRLVLSLGLVVFLVSLIVLIYTFIRYLTGETVSGWAFLACSIWIVGGLQMACIGLIGEYIGKIYAETKHRPKYFIEETICSK